MAIVGEEKKTCLKTNTLKYFQQYYVYPSSSVPDSALASALVKKLILGFMQLDRSKQVYTKMREVHHELANILIFA